MFCMTRRFVVAFAASAAWSGICGCGSSRPAATSDTIAVIPIAGVGDRAGGAAGFTAGAIAATGASGRAAITSLPSGGRSAIGTAGTGGTSTTPGASGTASSGAGSGGSSVAQAGTAAASSGSGGRGAASSATFRNPLNKDEGSDPWLLSYDGKYYLAATTWSSALTMRSATTLAGLKTAPAVKVWTGDDPSRCCNMWAPEFHLLDGPNGKRWYLYYTAGPEGSDTGNQRMHVLESDGTDPLGPYKYKARIYDKANDAWAIDSSVFTLDDRLYYLFSAWEGENQEVFIAGMSNPWTMNGSRVRVSVPTLDWERKQGNVNEGPVALQHDGKTFVVYSASACWGPDYALGMLTLQGTNPLDPSSWVKSKDPVFRRDDKNSAFGPGHNGFFKSRDGSEDWIVYHANAAVSGACDTKRTTRVQKFGWNTDGTPALGAPVATDIDIAVPAGD
jgi:GH43 family beta-xylosidase